MFSKLQNKAEFKNLDDSAVISSDFPGLRTFAASITSTASTTSVASVTSTASFHQKNTHPDGWIILTTKMTNTSSYLRNRSSKIQFFTDIWYPFCWRLWRPAYVNFLKTGWWNSDFQTSEIYKYLQTKSNLYTSICQSRFIRNISMWDTLYYLKLDNFQKVSFSHHFISFSTEVLWCRISFWKLIILLKRPGSIFIPSYTQSVITHICF